jgi:hypothetical protein
MQILMTSLQKISITAAVKTLSHIKKTNIKTIKSPIDLLNLVQKT